MLRINLEMVVSNAGNLPVFGLHNLQAIPHGKSVIITTTHLTDIDVQAAAYVLGSYFDVIITNESTHYEKNKYRLRLAMFMAGKSRFLPITYTRNHSAIPVPVFDPNNYKPMRDALKSGKTLVISAHNPSIDGKMPVRGGLAAVYLAQLAKNSVILPVAVSVEGESKPTRIAHHWKPLIQSILSRSKAKITVGKPLQFEEIEVGSTYEHYKSVKEKLIKQSNMIMNKLTQMLQPEKR